MPTVTMLMCYHGNYQHAKAVVRLSVTPTLLYSYALITANSSNYLNSILSGLHALKTYIASYTAYGVTKKDKIIILNIIYTIISLPAYSAWRTVWALVGGYCRTWLVRCAGRWILWNMAGQVFGGLCTGRWTLWNMASQVFGGLCAGRWTL